MSIAKVIEITSSSEKGFKDAVEKGIKRAAKTVGKIQGAWVSEEKVLVEDGEITEWRVTMRVTFVLEEG
jgi:flavin-binding protein dodecin